MKRTIHRLCALLTAMLTVLVLCAGVFALPAAAKAPGKWKIGFALEEPADGGAEKFIYVHTVTEHDTDAYINLSDIAEIPTPTKEGYTFVGWFKGTGKDAQQVWSIRGDELNNDSGVVLYAHWTPLPAEPTPEPIPTPEPTPTPNPYSGEGAYIVAVTATDTAGGEIGVIKKGDCFNLVLRVIDHSAARFHIPAGDIAARINSAAFTFTGTAEIGQLFEESDPVTQTQYYTYVLLFRDVLYNGGGSEMNVNLSYTNSTLAMQQLAVTLGQCADANATPTPDKARTPNLVVRQSSYGNTAVTAGKAFTLNVTVFATAGSESLADVIASVTLPKGITLTGGSLSQYIGGMGPGSVYDVRFEVLPSAAFTDGVADLTVHLTGTGAESSTAVTSDTIISVPVLQPDRFEVSNVESSDTVYIGQGGSVTVNFVNKGRNVVANLEAEITGNNLGVDIPRVYVGNVNAGTENSVDFSLYPEQPGPMDGTITLTYESEDGTVKTLTETFTATAMEMENYYDPGLIDDPGMMDEPAGAGMPVWGWVLIALAVATAVVVVVVLVRRRKKAKALAALGEADDEDF